MSETNTDDMHQSTLAYLGSDFVELDRNGAIVKECPKELLDEVENIIESKNDYHTVPHLLSWFQDIYTYSKDIDKEVLIQLIRSSQGVMLRLKMGDKRYIEDKVDRENEILLDVHTHPGDYTAISLSRDTEIIPGLNQYNGDYDALLKQRPKISGIISDNSALLFRESTERNSISHIAKYAYLRWFLMDENNKVLTDKERQNPDIDWFFQNYTKIFNDCIGTDAHRVLTLLEVDSLLERIRSEKIPKDLENIHPDRLIAIVLGYAFYFGKLWEEDPRIYRLDTEIRGLRLSES